MKTETGYDSPDELVLISWADMRDTLVSKLVPVSRTGVLRAGEAEVTLMAVMVGAVVDAYS